MKNIIHTLLLLLLTVFPLRAEYTPEDMPNVNIANRYEYVSDPGNLLRADTKDEVNRILWNLRQQTSAEVVVAIPPDIGDEPIEDWSESLFTSWGIGKSDKDNGVLIVIAPAQRKARIQTGYGIEGILPDIVCKKLITSQIVPHMKENDLDDAVLASVSKLSEILLDPTVADELKSNKPDNFGNRAETLDKSVIFQFLGIIFLVCFIISAGYYIKTSLSLRGEDNYHKALGWRHSLNTLGWMILFSAGTAVIFYLLAYINYRRNRTH